uniref:RIIa domain-containing protein n=1 Tax=Strix occidentalis caurina TaxID=311401 RepID=A0A8D0FZB7_STROC
MQSSKISLIVPCGLQTLLEGVSRAVIEDNPDNIAEFFALYFQDLVTFQKGLFLPSPGMLYFPLECRGEPGFTLFSGEPKRMDKCTDTEEDQLLEEPDVQYSSRVTQHPSTASSIAGSSSPPGSDGASSPEGPELVYVPAELAAHVLGNSDSLYSVRNVATSVQTLHEDSQTSEDEFTPVEAAAEDASAIPAAEASVEAVRSQSGVWSQCSIAGELGPSDSQADVSTNYVNQAFSIPLWEEPSPSALSPPPSPAPKDPLQAVPSCKEGEVISTTEAVSLWWDDELITDAEVPSYVEQFPQKIVIPFIDQTAYLLKIEQPLNAVQSSSDKILCPPADDFVCHLERMESTARVESAEQISYSSTDLGGFPFRKKMVVVASAVLSLVSAAGLSGLSTGHRFHKQGESSSFLVKPSPASLPCGDMHPAPPLPSWRNPPGWRSPAQSLPGTANLCKPCPRPQEE